MMSNKFRVWDKRENRYSKGFMMYQNGVLTHLSEPIYEENYTVEWFTGFSDKNGREIYEGDLITHRHSDQPHRVFFGKEQGCFYAKYAESKMSCMPLALLHETEIIGTVHDNSSEKANSSEVEGA